MRSCNNSGRVDGGLDQGGRRGEVWLDSVFVEKVTEFAGRLDMEYQ